MPMARSFRYSAREIHSGCACPDRWRSVPEGLLPRLYYRQLDPGDEVPTGLDGRLLTANSHNRLPENERGAIRHFRRDGAELEEVASNTYQSLPEGEKGPVRYFRVVTSLGEQTVFTALGDSLSDSQYARLSANERGRVVGPGRLLRLRFYSAVYLPSTQLEVAVRHSSLAALWQDAEDQDCHHPAPGELLGHPGWRNKRRRRRSLHHPPIPLRPTATRLTTRPRSVSPCSPSPLLVRSWCGFTP